MAEISADPGKAFFGKERPDNDKPQRQQTRGGRACIPEHFGKERTVPDPGELEEQKFSGWKKEGLFFTSVSVPVKYSRHTSRSA
jgi:hypothetical protein